MLEHLGYMIFICPSKHLEVVFQVTTCTFQRYSLQGEKSRPVDMCAIVANHYYHRNKQPTSSDTVSSI